MKTNRTMIRAIAVAVAMAALVFALYRPALYYSFTNYDEVGQILENPLVRSLDAGNIKKIFSSFCITSYYPVRLLSFAVDYRFWGMNPRGFHLTNVLIHALSAVLLYLLLLRWNARAGGAAENGVALPGLAALLFAVHPVCVEPVAWVPGREELLTLLFTMLALHLFTFYLESRDGAAGRISRRAGWMAYAGTFLCVAAACLSNVVGVVSALAISVYGLLLPRGGEALAADAGKARNGKAAAAGPRGDRGAGVGQRRGRALEAIAPVAAAALPFLLVGIAAVVVKKIGEARAVELGLGLAPVGINPLFRVLAVPMVYALNLKTFLAPSGLNLIYPTMVFEHPATLAYIGAGLVAGIFTLVFLRKLALEGIKGDKTSAMAAFCIIWFVLALLPSAQFMQHRLVRSDRLIYPALPGLVCAAYFLATRYRRRGLRVSTGNLCLVLAAASGLLALAAWNQLPVWKNSLALWTSVLRKNPDCAVAHNNYGNALRVVGRLEDAIFHYRKAVELDPKDSQSWMNMGGAFVFRGKFADAESAFLKALAINPRDVKSLNGLGAALYRMGREQDGVDKINEAMRLGPDIPDPLVNLGVFAFEKGRNEEALSWYEKARELGAESAELFSNIGAALSRLGRLDDAIEMYNKAVEINPYHAMGFYNLGAAMEKKGLIRKAEEYYRISLNLAPDDPITRSNLAEVYAKQGKYRDAIMEYEEILRRYPNESGVIARIKELKSRILKP